jgi:hypothetical protein
MLVKSILVPLVEATAVPCTIFWVAVYVEPSVLKGICPIAVGLDIGDAGAALVHVVPLLVSTFPEVPGAV